jgi:hypothetical protein
VLSIPVVNEMLAEALAVCVDSNTNVPPPAIPAKSVTLLTDVLFTAARFKDTACC